jgi:hypothetical protein
MKRNALMAVVAMSLACLATAEAAPNVNQTGGSVTSVAGEARLQGTLQGGGPADVDVYWGPTDGGTTPADWAHKERLTGVKDKDTFGIAIGKLTYGMTYHYRCQASNASGAAWAPATTPFTTSKPKVPAPGANQTPALTVTSGLVCWYDAAVGVTANAEGVVQSWKDLSGNEHHATLAAGAPVLAANQIQSKPAVQFRTASHPCGLNLDGPFFIEQQYVVVRSPNAVWNSDGGFLGRRWARKSSYRLAGKSTKFNGDRFPKTVSKNGKDLKNPPFDLATITDYMILRIDVGDEDMSNNTYQIGMADAASCDFDVAEILGFQTCLSASDEELVGGYLAAKYGIKTDYPACAGQVSASALVNEPVAAPAATSATLAATLTCPGSLYDVRVFWGTRNGGTDPAQWTHSASAGTFTDVAAKKLSFTATGLTPGETYYYTFRGTNPLDSFWASKVLSFTTPATAVPQPPVLQVKKGLVCWYDAAEGVTAKPDGGIETWNDLSGNGHHATSGGGAPVRVIDQLNLKPVVQFRKNWLALAGTFFAKEHYLVIRSPGARWNAPGGLLGRLKGRGSSYNAWSNESGFWRDQYPEAVSRNGTVLPGPAFDCSPLNQFMILKIIVNDHDTSEAAYAIGNNDGMFAGEFDVAEILGYQSMLTPAEEELVGAYLAAKYGIRTAYPPLPSTAAGAPPTAATPYKGWQHSASMHLLTTPEGANLPATASEVNFPVLVRLNKDWFDFAGAKTQGEDIRFATGTGLPMAYQIDRWDAAAGSALIWVRVPEIKGNARLEIKMFWGKADASSESSGPAVFNRSNGYLSVWHMNDPVADDAGMLESKDIDTTSSAGMVGLSRRFSGAKGIDCGNRIAGYPFASSPHTSEAWFKGEKLNTSIVSWGKHNLVNLQLMSTPTHVSAGGVHGTSVLRKSEWVHVVYTYDGQSGRIYVNGQPDIAAPQPVTVEVLTPVSLTIGGGFVGDIDEVRISRFPRSADWVKLQYENQKPLQTLVGPMVQSGSEFSLSEKSINLLEGGNIKVSAKAGGAQKIYWAIKQGESESVVDVDRFNFTLDAGRVTGDQAFTLRLKAVYADGVKTLDIPVAIKEGIPDPVFTLQGPAKWDGREMIDVVPVISNLNEMKAKNAGELSYDWTVPTLVELKEVAPGKLTLKHSRNSGKLTVTAAASNGGKPVTQTIEIEVKEPAKDAWVRRVPGKDEQPVNHQFYARDDRNEGTLYYHGSMTEPADSVFLKVYADDKLVKTESQKPTADKTFGFSIKLKPGLIKYKVEFGSKVGNDEKVLKTVTNLVCGDAYLINGQSNALATDWGPGEHPDTSEWIRSFGDNGGDIASGWGNAVRRQGGHWQIGCWGMDLAILLVESQKVPICIMNGAVGGTLIEAHQRNEADPLDKKSIYGRLLNRIEQAGLTDGIRGAFWHQGECNQSNWGETGGYGWESHERHFLDMTAAWTRDYPNIRHNYIFQIWPNSCSIGGNRHSDKLREVQRLLPRHFSNMTIQSTLGVKPEGPCHFPPAGYAELARQLLPVVEHYNYGKTPATAVTAADLKKATYTTDKLDEIALEFDQPMAWYDALGSQFYLDGEADKVAAGSVSGNIIKLKLTSPATAKTITYLVDKKWDSKTLLYGKNGIAALTFFEVPLLRAGSSH